MFAIYFSVNKLKFEGIKNVASSSLHCRCRRTPFRIDSSRAQISLDMLSRTPFLVAICRATMDSYIYRLWFCFTNVKPFEATCLGYSWDHLGVVEIANMG